MDRDDFVEAGALRNGERLTTVSGGIARVDHILAVGQPSTVYNLEVHFDHVYFVSPLGILVQNSCQEEFGKLGEKAAKRYINEFVDAGRWQFRGALQDEATGNGIDLIFKSKGKIERFLVVEVKASRRRWRTLSKLQAKGVREYTQNVLNRVDTLKNVSQDTKKLAKELQTALDDGIVRGYFVQIKTSQTSLRKFADRTVHNLNGVYYSDWDDWIR